MIEQSPGYHCNEFFSYETEEPLIGAKVPIIKVHADYAEKLHYIYYKISIHGLGYSVK